jgi:hypothetical protein
VIEHFDLLLHEEQIGGELIEFVLHGFLLSSGTSNVDFVFSAVAQEFRDGNFGEQVNAQDEEGADFVGAASNFANGRGLNAQDSGEFMVSGDFKEIFDGVDEFMFIDM